MVTAMLAIALVVVSGQAFGIDNKKIPAKKKVFEELLYGGTSKNDWSTNDNIQFLKIDGSGDRNVVLMKNGKKAQISSLGKMNAGKVYNVESIKTVSQQYVEFVTWSGTVPWDTIKAKGGAYFRLEPGSELVFIYDPIGRLYGFYLKSGKVSWDINYITYGEAVEFTEAVAKYLDYSKAKSEVAALKKIFDNSKTKNLCPSLTPATKALSYVTGGFTCSCKGVLVDHIIIVGALNAAFTGAFLGALPAALSLPLEYRNMMPQYRKNAAMAYSIALAYGHNPTQKQFEMHLFEMLSGGTFSSARMKQLSGMVADEAIVTAVEKASLAIAKKIAPGLISNVPGVGNAIGATWGAITGGSEVSSFAKKAKDFYKP